MHSEDLREKMKEKKRRDKESKIRNDSPAPGLMLQCLSVQDDTKIPQLDGPHSDGSDDDFEQDSEANEVDNDELQHLCVGFADSLLDVTGFGTFLMELFLDIW